MNAVVIIQARMSSKRLPNKILNPINSKPLLLYLCEKFRHNGINDFIIATSSEHSDDPVEKFCVENDIKYFRGSLNNVANRFKNIIETHQLDAFIRICGDSPLLDTNIIHNALNIFQKNEFDIVTNVLKRTFPKGQSVEIVNAKCFLRTYPKIEQNPKYFEHVTKYFYENENNFKIHNIESQIDAGKIQLSIDSPEDFKLIETIMKKMQKPHWNYRWQECLQLLEAV